MIALLNHQAHRTAMTTVRLNYDGWLALPAGMRAKLGLSTGDQIDLELADGGIMLRARRSGGIVEQQAPELPVAAAEPTAAAPPPAAAAAPVVRRGPGRPKKTELPVVPRTLKARGGKRKAATPA
jgi:bifunctional DNA-binding transcriptional regulator/antitoxin component of YhaV-PrlF toxin-antitoxin module